MNGSRFDSLSKVLARSTSRRDALRALGGFLGIAALGSVKVARAAAQIACPPPLSSCSGACVNETSDPHNCGGCGTVCPTGQFCAAGQCQCPPGLTLCGTTCRNIQTDVQNCGTCGTACPQGQVCKNGACQLPAGVTTICNGVPSNTQSDPTNCGACGVRCTASQQFNGQCCGGVCCPTGTTCLNGACSVACNGKIVNLQTDSSNCGSCGHVCPAPISGTAVCAGGVCLPSSCAGVKANNPSAPDGTYLLDVNGHSLSVYCANMAGTPAEYLTLVHTGGSSNFSQYTAGGDSPGTNVRTNYTRIRLDPSTLKVNIADQTFATSTGSLLHSGNTTVTSMPYGVAMACVDGGDAAGSANIDLTGTPLAVVSTFAAGGNSPAGSSTPSANNQVVNLTGGGFCGWDALPGLFNPFNTSPAGDANQGFDLQLAFV